MKNILYKFLATAFISLAVLSCELTELDLTKSPNSLTPEQANIDFVLNGMQISLSRFFNDDDPASWDGISQQTMEMVRMKDIFGTTYEEALGATELDALWSTAYVSILRQANELIPQAEAQELWYHAGMAKTIQAYTLMTLVDVFGEVPFSQSFDPSNFNPTVDGGEATYTAAYNALISAREDFGKDAISVATDVYYDGDTDNWIKLVNTLLLKYHLNLRLLYPAESEAAINDLVNNHELIDEEDEDFEFKYSTNEVDPNSRHPYFHYNYVNGANQYMANYYIGLLYNEKPLVDPRLRSYMYRQDLDIPTDVQELPCLGRPKPDHYLPEHPFCHLAEGYWGRDHLNSEGIPPDNGIRTIFGLYPAGGRYDANQGEIGDADHGAKGAGIEPLMLSSFTHFMLAEAEMTLGAANPDGANTYLHEGIRLSMEKVLGFREDVLSADELIVRDAVAATVPDYHSQVDTLWKYAVTPEAKLNVVAKEYFIALFGNGVESYNLYRRTGMPLNIQPSITANPGEFWRTFKYPANCVNFNSSINQKSDGRTQVFWDNNEAGFIN